jgi:microsomal dipeptidase-like Zn-dependent dipeptidase
VAATKPGTDADHKSCLVLAGLTGPDDYPALVAALRGRGYAGERLEAIMNGNWLRILRAALPGEA